MTGGEQIDLDNLREQAIQAIRDGDESAMRDLARLAIAAFGRRGEGSGVLGVDVQRIRRALDLRTRRSRARTAASRSRATRSAASSSSCGASSSARRSSAPAALPPARPLNELDRALPSGPLQDLAAVHRVVMQLKRRLATQGHETRGRRAHAHVDVRRTMRASLQTGGVPVVLKYRPQRPRRPELYVLCDVSTSVTSASVFFLSVLHALHDSFRKMRSFVFVERISEVTDVFARERNFKAVSEAIGRDAGVADVSGYTDYGRVWREFLDAGRGRPAPARDGDRARRRAHERARPARRRVRRASPPAPAARSGSTPSRSCTGTTATRSSAPTRRSASCTSAGRRASSRTSSRRSRARGTRDDLTSALALRAAPDAPSSAHGHGAAAGSPSGSSSRWRARCAAATGSPIEARTLDLGPGGMSVTTNRPLAPGRASLHLRPPALHPAQIVDGSARVLREQALRRLRAAVRALPEPALGSPASAPSSPLAASSA